MCGIIGIVGGAPVADRLVDGLKRLEYRGYDSAGIAVLQNGTLDRRRAEGKLVNLVAALKGDPIDGMVGIGHTRWATHGAPNEINAHPHMTRRVAIVHNGIIENHADLKDELRAKGHVFTTETDTETVAHLLTDLLDAGYPPKGAMLAAMERIDGAFALAVLVDGAENLLMGARRGSPLAVGFGQGEMYLGSDAIALAPLSRRIAYLEEGDVVILTRDTVDIVDASGAPVQRPVKLTELTGATIGKGNHRHFMLKEIHEQPAVVGDTLTAYLAPGGGGARLPDLPFDLAGVRRLVIVACGTSYYAGLTAKYWIEQIARLPVELDIASEFRYRTPPLQDGDLALFISQSGETIDTLAAHGYARSQGIPTLALVNVPESTLARDATAALRTLAGPEIGVASTKAFTTQLAVLAALALALARVRGTLTGAEEKRLALLLADTPARMAEVLHRLDVSAAVERLTQARDVLYLGRGALYPIALEGALKLKELSYIHAEAYAAGEMKHGPIALIDEDVPVIVLAPRGPLFEKTASNIQEVAARKAKVIAISDADGLARLGGLIAHGIELPEIDPFAAPLLYSLPVQMLAYQVAVTRGTDVDQPRNLAKSVTVE